MHNKYCTHNIYEFSKANAKVHNYVLHHAMFSAGIEYLHSVTCTSLIRGFGFQNRVNVLLDIPNSTKYLRNKIFSVFTIYSLSANFFFCELSVEQYSLIQVMVTTVFYKLYLGDVTAK